MQNQTTQVLDGRDEIERLKARVNELEKELSRLREASEFTIESRCQCGHKLIDHALLPSYYDCDVCSCDNFEKAV